MTKKNILLIILGILAVILVIVLVVKFVSGNEAASDLPQDTGEIFSEDKTQKIEATIDRTQKEERFITKEF